MQDHIEAFLMFLKLNKNYADLTIKNYRYDLKKWQDFLTKNNLTHQNLKSQHIRNWLKYLNTQKLQAKSIQRALSTLKSFYTFMHHEGHINTNPTFSITPPKAQKKLPALLDADEMKHILECLNRC